MLKPEVKWSPWTVLLLEAKLIWVAFSATCVHGDTQVYNATKSHVWVYGLTVAGACVDVFVPQMAVQATH